LPPGDGFPFGIGVDDVIAEICEYVTGEIRLPASERRVAVILFTDLVGSTGRAAATGDAAWKRLLDRHDEINRTAVARRGVR
jgi:class 3 adenylate cyclase